MIVIPAFVPQDPPVTSSARLMMVRTKRIQLSSGRDFMKFCLNLDVKFMGFSPTILLKPLKTRYQRN